MAIGSNESAADVASSNSVSGASVEEPSLAARAVGSSVWSIANQAFQVVLGLVSFALLSRWLTPAHYGLFGMAATVTGFLGVVGDAGVSLAVIRSPKLTAEIEATAFWLSIAGATILTVACAIAAPFIGLFFRDPAITYLALGMAATFVVAAPGRVPAAKLTRQLRFRATTAIGIAVNIGSTVIAVVAASRGFGAWALVLQMGTSMAIQAVLATLLARPKIRPSLVSRSQARNLASFGSQLSGFSMATMVSRSLDNILGGRFLGSAAVGLMSMGFKLVFFPVERLCGAIYMVFLPTTAQIGDVAQQARAFRSASRLLLMIVAPFCLGTVAIAPEIVALLPPQWAAITPLLRVYALTALILPPNYLALSVLIARGRTAVLLRTALGLIPICWSGAALGAWSGSVLVMVGAWAFGIFLGASVLIAVVWKLLELGRVAYWRAVSGPILISAVMAIGVRAGLHLVGIDGRAVGVAVGAGLGAVIYAGLVRATMAADVTRIVGLLRQSVTRRRGEGPGGHAAPA